MWLKCVRTFCFERRFLVCSPQWITSRGWETGRPGRSCLAFCMPGWKYVALCESGCAFEWPHLVAKMLTVWFCLSLSRLKWFHKWSYVCRQGQSSFSDSLKYNWTIWGKKKKSTVCLQCPAQTDWSGSCQRKQFPLWHHRGVDSRAIRFGILSEKGIKDGLLRIWIQGIYVSILNMMLL